MPRVMRPARDGGRSRRTARGHVDAVVVPVSMTPAPQRNDNRKARPAKAEAADDRAIKIVGKYIGRVIGIRPRPVNEVGIVDRNDSPRSAGSMVMAPSCVDTTTCDVEASLPAASARARRRWIESITAAWSARKTLPTRSVHPRLSSIICKIWGKGTRDFTLGSHDSGASASASWSPLSAAWLGSCNQRSAWTTSSRMRSSHQDLSYKRVGIQRVGRQHLVKLLRRALRRVSIRSVLLGERHGDNQQDERQSNRQRLRQSRLHCVSPQEAGTERSCVNTFAVWVPYWANHPVPT